MYILVRSKAPKGWAVNSVGHGALACYLQYKDHSDVVDWLENSFRKVTCKVTDEELVLAKSAGDYVEITESGLDNMLMCVAFRPRENYPCYFQGFKLYS